MAFPSCQPGRLLPRCGSGGPHFPRDPHSKCPSVIILPSQGDPRQSLPSNSPPNHTARSQRCFVTQTCIRFIHKTAWFPKTIQTACSSAGSWPRARGPLGHPPPLAGDHAKKPFLLLPSARPEKKGLIFSKGSSQVKNYGDMGSPDLNR